jgi:hypothetical protein
MPHRRPKSARTGSIDFQDFQPMLLVEELALREL